jgi:hypothetical protein
MKRREFIGLLGAVLTVRPQDGAAHSATIRRNVAMTDSSTVKDLGAVFDAHVKAEFIDKDVAATMATMVGEPYLTHRPTLTSATGRSEVEKISIVIISLATGLTTLRSNLYRAPSVRIVSLTS